MLKKILKNKRGDVIQFILVLAVVAIILAFAFPKFKAATAKGTAESVTDMTCVMTGNMPTVTATTTLEEIKAAKC